MNEKKTEFILFNLNGIIHSLNGVPMLHFYIPRKRQKSKGFLTFSGGKEMEHRTQVG